jgi:hypothetical protein
MRAPTVLDDLSPTRVRALSSTVCGYVDSQDMLEGECLLMTKAERFKPHWVVLMGNEVYFFRAKDEPSHLFMHSLAGTFIKDLP